MEPSILLSTKKVLGIADSYTVFDLDILTHINATFSILDQLGVGPDGGFYIEDEAAVWDDLGLPANQLNLVKTFVLLKVRLLFDPPSSSFAIAAIEKQIEQYEWRLNTMREWALDPVDPLTEVEEEELEDVDW